MSSTLLDPATTMRCDFEQRARAIIGSMIRSAPQILDWVMTFTIQVNMPVVPVARIF
jgi:hypothetical protein